MSIKDGLSAIAKEVIGDVQKEAEAIILAAEKEAKETLRVAKEQADKNSQAIINEAKAKAENEKRKTASVTQEELRNRLLQTKEGLIDAAFDNALIKFKEYVETKDYRVYLLKLIEEATKRIDQKNLVVQLNAKDTTWLTQEILNQLSKKSGYKLKFSKETEDFIGGCKIQTVDGKITYDSTIDGRLQELKPALRIVIARLLFGKEA